MERTNWIIGRLRISKSLEEDLLNLRRNWLLDLVEDLIQCVRVLFNRDYHKKKKRKRNIKNFLIEQVLDQVVFDLDPVATVIDQLEQKGYSKTFERKDYLLRCSQNREFYPLADLVVDEIYRFDDDSGVLGRFFMFAVHHRWTGIKGIFVAEVNDIRLQFNGNVF